MAESDSIRKRFFFTLVSRVTVLAGSILTAGIVPRSIGVRNYGNVHFLLHFFKELKGLTDVSVSSAFFTLCSKKKKTGMLLLLYPLWELIQLGLFAGLIAAADVLDVRYFIWPGQKTPLIWAVAGVSLLMFWRNGVMRFADSKKLTITAQVISMILSLVQVGVIVWLYVVSRLTLSTYIAVNYIVLAAIIMAVGLYVYRQRRFYWVNNRSWQRMKKIGRYFLRYCSPMLVFILVSFVYGIFQRWFLQLIGGSDEQGAFSLAFRWSQIIIVFTSSIVPICWQEIAAAFGRNDPSRIQELFDKAGRMFYFLASYFAAFICVQSAFLVQTLAGEEYSGAILPLMLMAFYPVHQALSHIVSMQLKATEKTALYRDTGLAGMPAGILLTYLLLAPRDYWIPGLHLNASGLAIQILVTQFFIVNLRLFYICRSLSISYVRLLVFQAWVPVLLLLTALAVKAGVCYSGMSGLLVFLPQPFSGFFIQGMIYTFSVSVIVLLVPGSVRTDRREIAVTMKSAILFFRKDSHV